MSAAFWLAAMAAALWLAGRVLGEGELLLFLALMVVVFVALFMSVYMGGMEIKEARKRLRRRRGLYYEE